MVKYIGLLAVALLLVSCGNTKPKAEAGEDYEMIVRNNVAEVQRILPQTLGNGFVLSKMYLKSNHVVYEYAIDENLIDMSSPFFKESNMKAEIRASMHQMSDADKQAFRSFLQAICQTGRDLVYLYVGNKTHTELRVVFSKEELEEM